MRQIVQIICGDTQPVQNLRVLNYVGDKKVEWANHWISFNFDGIIHSSPSLPLLSSPFSPPPSLSPFSLGLHY